MRILPRYVLIETAKVFLVSLTVLTAMMIIVGVVREAAMQNLPLGQIVRLIPYIWPEALRIAVPVTLLLATTSVYGRMSGSNEVVAAKALGISPMTLLWPTLVAAFLLSLVTVWINDLAVSWGRSGARRIVVEAVEEIAYGMLRAQKSYNSPTFSINVKRVEGRRLLQPTVTIQARGDSPTITVRAEEAELNADRQAQALKIRLLNGTIDVDVAGVATFDFQGVEEYEIPLGDATRAKNVAAVPSCMSLRVIPEKTAAQRRTIQRLRQDHAARAAYEMLTGDFDALTSQEWNARAEDLRYAEGHLHRLLTEPHRRWSAGFSCLCFAWIGAPMAMRLRNRDFLTSFFLCFLPILVVYYPLLAYGVDGAKSGSIPPYAVWAGNILLIAWGAWLLRKVIRY